VFERADQGEESQAVDAELWTFEDLEYALTMAPVIATPFLHEETLFILQRYSLVEACAARLAQKQLDGDEKSTSYATAILTRCQWLNVNDTTSYSGSVDLKRTWSEPRS